MITFAILILIVAKALPGLNTHISSIHVTRITSIVFLFAGALSLNSLNLENIGSGIGIYSGFFQVTTISQLIEIFLFIIGGGILIAWPHPSGGAKAPAFGGSSPSEGSPPKREGEFPPCLKAGEFPPKGEGVRSAGADYSLVVLFSSLGSSLLISSYDLISVYLSIELQSFGLYVLSTLYRDSESSTSAGLKYFLLGGLSSCIILLGTGIIYSYTGTTNLESLYIINSVTDGSRLYIMPEATTLWEASESSSLWQSPFGQGINLGLSLIFIGFLFKIAAAPLHNWSPDVYDGTPTIVTIWLTIIPKIAILFILLELQIKLGSFGLIGGGLKTIIINNSGYLLNFNLPSTPSPFGDPLPLGTPPLVPSPLAVPFGRVSFGERGGDNILKILLLISATFSLIIGSLLGLAQIRIKRLLAYSTISHIGFILLALAVNTEQSIDSFIFYIIQYTITNLNIFLVILGLTYCLSNYTDPLGGSPRVATAELLPLGRGRFPPLLKLGEGVLRHKDINLISEFKGLFFSNPLLSISLAVSLFSMAGIPPLIGFFSKQLVLYSALQNGYYFISVLAIIVSVISCSYYLKLIKLLFSPSEGSPPKREGESPSLSKFPAFRQSPLGGTKVTEGEGEINLTNTHSYLISTLTFTILLFFIKPSLILNSTQLLSLSLFYI